MSDLNPEGLERAAEAVQSAYEENYIDQHGREQWERNAKYWATVSDSARLSAERYAHAAVSAYLGHTVTTVEEES